MNKKFLPPLLAALALTAWPAIGALPGKVIVDTAPPPPYAEESMPAPRAGYVWAPGYWSWTGSKHEWVKGHYVAERKGYRYTAPRWAQENGRWTLYPENWVKNEDDKEKTVMKDSSLPSLPKQ
jgi:hypothetical protein